MVPGIVVQPMVTVRCAHCGGRVEPYGDFQNYAGPISCVGCHKATWVSIVRGAVVASERWPRAAGPG